MFKHVQLYHGQNSLIILGTMVLLMLSAFDAGATLWGLYHGLITEANPLMRLLIDASPGLFVAFKLLLPMAAGVLFWLIRDRSVRLVYIGLSVTLGTYLIVGLIHIHWCFIISLK